ncbi:hypothetical protein GWI33_003602 [Rhynchophorus ferrugineus]|uniref:Uncharacterized protein n=1 Tax=Rhynchophorus ferrugineus TaxID=354439 RepID=A0A834M2W7_RHYFE|nr:hypothetical protein GWI33_003602 [Rhynchophorus ferrugineus]
MQTDPSTTYANIIKHPTSSTERGCLRLRLTAHQPRGNRQRPCTSPRSLFDGRGPKRVINKEQLSTEQNKAETFDGSRRGTTAKTEAVEADLEVGGILSGQSFEF